MLTSNTYGHVLEQRQRQVARAALLLLLSCQVLGQTDRSERPRPSGPTRLRLSEATVLEALSDGHFYASSGVELADVSRGRRELAIDVVQQYDLAYRTTFIGRGGEVLDIVGGVEPR